MFIDSHAHLAELSPEQFELVIQRAEKAGVTTIVNVGTNISTSTTVCNQCHYDSGVKILAAAAISPPDIGFVTDSWESELRKILERPEIVAVGETGIDGVNSSYLSIEHQRPFFHRHLELAMEYDIPVIIHGRGAEREALETCVAMGVKKALFHCFTGTSEEAKLIVDAGYTISFSGIITFKKSGYDEIVKSIPESQLLFETDSPYLAPVPVRGTVNEPANVSHIYRYVADLRGVSVETVAAGCRTAFDSLFLPRF